MTNYRIQMIRPRMILLEEHILTFSLHSISWPAQWDAGCSDELYLLRGIVWCTVDLLWWPDIIVVWGVIAVSVLQCYYNALDTEQAPHLRSDWDRVRSLRGQSLLLWQIKMRDARKILTLCHSALLGACYPTKVNTTCNLNNSSHKRVK